MATVAAATTGPAIGAATPAIVSAAQEHTTGRPDGFSIDYQFDMPGRRDWERRPDGTWTERCPDYEITTFDEGDPTNIDGDSGTIIVSGDGKFFVFVPDRDSKLLWARFGNPATGPRSFLGKSYGIE